LLNEKRKKLRHGPAGTSQKNGGFVKVRANAAGEAPTAAREARALVSSSGILF
jgi:hypothetical protein